jgi:hypothetical protein
LHGSNVADEGFLTEVFDIRILEAQILELVCDALLLFLTHIRFQNRHLFVFQLLHHSLLLAGVKEEDSTPFTLKARSSSNAVNIGVNIFWRVDLYDPVHGREVNASGNNIRSKETRIFSSAESFCDCQSCLLFLPPDEV